VTARAFDSMFLFIDFVRVTNCFYDYDYDYVRPTDITKMLNTVCVGAGGTGDRSPTFRTGDNPPLSLMRW